MTVILGINAFHADAAACLLVDGKLVGAVAEERLGPRIKHSSAFPVNSILSLLSASNLRLRDVTHLAIARDTRANTLARASYAVRNPVLSVRATLEHFRRSRRSQGWLSGLAESCGEDTRKVQFCVVRVEHHLAHISSAYYLSPFEELTAGFSYDASGDFASLMAARCEGHRIDVLDRVCLPNSLGFFYTALCQFIGFGGFGEEYKVMGLAAYGEDMFSDEMRLLVRVKTGGWFRLGEGYFAMHSGRASGEQDASGKPVLGQLYTTKLYDLLGKPRDRKNPLTARECNLAKSTQRRFDEVALHCLERLNGLVNTHRLAMAGGCALNGVTNARIHRDTVFREQYIQPAASDDGSCLGAAYWCWHNVLGKTERFHMSHPFWGPEHSGSVLADAANKSGFLQRVFDSDESLVEAVAGLIARGWIVGWYQGRSEWGPRALGHRSILANPILPTIRDLINSKIKRRESFRPFAPSVLKEDVSTYFEQTLESPFMQHVVGVRKEWRDRIPSVTHVDGTSRLHTVEVSTSPLYYLLIKAFKRITGVGMLLNTSFNENEPIVETPQQAVDCFQRTDMDALCLGRFLLVRHPIDDSAVG